MRHRAWHLEQNKLVLKLELTLSGWRRTHMRENNFRLTQYYITTNKLKSTKTSFTSNGLFG